jgi:hypothetical protein
MKNISRILLFFGCLLGSTVPALSYPTLQLDILGGNYDPITQTIMAPSNSFTLYAYLIPDRSNSPGDTYYLSAALVPRTGPDQVELGSFNFNGTDIRATGEMVYGVPPLETITSLQGWDSGDLAKHGIFNTFFSEFEFQFSNNNGVTQYNTQTRAINGGAIPTGGTGMYFAAFNVDTTNLASGYSIHFDLYNTKLKGNLDTDVTQFAPFSHDAQSSSTSVPEPATLLLFGSGLLGLGLIRRRGFGR